MVRHVDLCAGSGAFTLALQDVLGSTCVFANDMCTYSKQTYDANFTHELLCQDIHQIDPADVPEHDVLTAGFPCQSFSNAGLKLGFADERANVFLKVVEIMKAYKPRVAVLENVRGLLQHDSGRTFDIIVSSLAEIGYTVKWALLNTKVHTDIPQNRERVYIYCFRDTEDAALVDATFEPCAAQRPLSSFLLDKDVPIGDKYYYTSKSRIYDRLVKGVVKRGVFYRFYRSRLLQNREGECSCLMAAMGSGGNNVPLLLDERGIRKLTVREVFRLQGFPDSYVLPENVTNYRMYKIAGNAVTVSLAKLVVARLAVLFQ